MGFPRSLLCRLAWVGAAWLNVTAAEAPRYARDGQLELPGDYREWVFLSSGLGMTYGPLAPGADRPKVFDNVFVTRAAYRAFLETGRWPDKTMFVLEIRYGATQGLPNKDGYFQTDLAGLEMLVRDETRFPDKWGFFDFPVRGGQPRKTGTLLGKQAGCLACHSANGAVDGTFVQFYPVLLEVATKKGTLRADYQPFTPSPARLYHVLADQGWPAAEQMLEAARVQDPGAAVMHAGTLVTLGHQILGAGKVSLAIPVFRWIARHHPQSASARDGLAAAFEAAGDHAQAVVAARQALELLPGDTSLSERQRAAIRDECRRRIEQLSKP